MEDIKISYVLLFALPLVFFLGWSMRGDHIYSGMFESTVSAMPLLKEVKK